MLPWLNRKIDEKLAAYQRDLIDIHYREVDNMYTQVRAWRHDTRNHLQILKVLAEKGDMDGVIRYLDELDKDLATIEPIVRTGNSMADAILNSKISLARAQDIPVRVDAHIPFRLHTSDLDLCVILGNLFDNAIEANLPLPPQERMIRVYMDMKGSQLYISFTNRTAKKKQTRVGGRFRTTKGEGHGFGLVRIDGIVERYEGYLNRSSEDGAFTTEILLPQEGDKE